MSYSKKFLGRYVDVIIDRPLGTKHPKHDFIYEVNYGFIPCTLAPDGEEIDAYVLGSNEPLTRYKGLCIAIIHRFDDDDDKLVVVPKGASFSDAQIRELTHFQEQFFSSKIIRT